jgi:hypothetical protein
MHWMLSTNTVANGFLLLQGKTCWILTLLPVIISMDSDELYAKLDKLADQIKTDSYVIPEAKKYESPNYKLTEQDKRESKDFR